MPIESLKQLKSDPQNRRMHNPRNLAMLQTALEQVGAARSIVIDETGEILAGNGLVQAATAAGLDKVQVVDVAGDTVVAVRRTGLTAEQKRALAIYDNRTAELAEWNWAQLAADQAAGLPLEPWWTKAELDLPPVAGRTDPEATPEPRPTGIQAGDLFELGAHRLLCGDATAAGDVARVLGSVVYARDVAGAAVPGLMVTDPPYGVDYDPTWRRAAGINKNPKKQGLVTNDDRADWSAAWRWFPGAVAYVWHAGLMGVVVHASLEQAHLIPRAQIVWAKDRLALGRGDYHWQHEPCFYAVRSGAPASRTADRTQTTLWTIPSRDDAGHGHSTQKPVECMARPMRNHDVHEVYDPFVGSGTSLVAAEMERRTCVALDIDPQYCQVAIDRWEMFTGQTAVKVGEAIRA